MVYTHEQLKEFAGNMNLFSGLQDVLELLSNENGLNMKDIGEKVNLNVYPRDKAILALEFSGFISKKEFAGSKIYSLTEQGRTLHQILGGTKE